MFQKAISDRVQNTESLTKFKNKAAANISVLFVVIVNEVLPFVSRVADATCKYLLQGIFCYEVDRAFILSCRIELFILNFVYTDWLNLLYFIVLRI